MSRGDLGFLDITPAALRYSQADQFTPANALYGPSGADIVSVANQVPVVGDFYAFPFWNPLGGVIDQIGFNVSTLISTSVARCGLYESATKDDGEATDRFLVPGKLVVDGGEQDCSTASAKMTTLNPAIRLNPRTLYWMVMLAGVASPNVTGFSSGWHLFGRNANFNAQFGWQKTGFGYKALPAVFPFGPPQPGICSSNPTLVVVRYASYDRFMRSHE